MKRGFVHELKDLSSKEEISTLISEDVKKRRERAVTTVAIVEVRRTFSSPLLRFEGSFKEGGYIGDEFFKKTD